MPKEVRRRIFYCLILVFLILGTGVVLYAQGWRWSSDPFGFGKVGAIYIRTFPANAEVSINGKIKERRIGLFDKGTLLNNILPGEYDLQVSHPGFRPWRLPVAVGSSLVTALQNVVLIPENSNTVTTTPVKDIKLAGNTLVIETQGVNRVLDGMGIPGDFLAGSEDGSVVLSYDSTNRNYYSNDVSKATSTNMGRLFSQLSGGAIVSFQSIPRDNTLFLAKTPTGLYLLRSPNGDMLRLATSSVSSSATAQGRVVWATFDKKDNSSLLSSYDIQSQDFNLNFELIPGQISSLLVSEPGEMIVLSNDGSLYSLNLAQSSRVRLAKDAKYAAAARSGDKLAVLDQKGIKIFSLRGNKQQADILISDAGRAQKLVWYRDNEHLFVYYPDKVMFLDLNDEDVLNYMSVSDSPITEYDPLSNTLYFLKETSLYSLVFP